MSSKHVSLDAAALDRKAHLAKLKTLKRKQPPTDSGATEAYTSESAASIFAGSLPTSTPETADIFLSGRNYDPETKGPKLGFENAPNHNADTLEDRATAVALETRQKEEKENKEEKPIDLFQLQPRKPNWDLKRDVARKMEGLNARTENAIARLVRERIEEQKKRALEITNGNGDEAGGQNVGMEGAELVEGMHIREREEEAELRKENHQDDELD